MACVSLPVALLPQETLLAALAELARATLPPLTDPNAPVRLVDLPLMWRTYLHDEAASFVDLVPPRDGEVRRADWARVLARLRRSIETSQRLAEILAHVERGPSPVDLARAPRLTPWAPARAADGALVLTGHVTGHPKLGEMWMRSSLLMGLDPEGRWARTWSRWYRLGEPMTDDDLSAFRQACVPAEPSNLALAPLEEHFADLRLRASQRLASLAPLALKVGEGWR